MPAPRRRARGFTLIELLVVITIIGLISAATLPTILPALNNRQASEAASILQAALINARDSAAQGRSPSGLRFLRDPGLALRDQGRTVAAPTVDPVILGYSSFVPVKTAPDYSEGRVNVFNSTSVATFATGSVTAVSPITIYGPSVSPLDTTQSPTSWYWNIRRGEKIQLNRGGPLYTIVGPMNSSSLGYFRWDSASNPEGFINEGPPGAIPTGGPSSGCEFLYLTDGKDNYVAPGNITGTYAKGGLDGYVDELFDGVDNNGDGTVDDMNEWEPDTLAVPIPAGGASYTIFRRPAIDARARVTSLPSDMVIDATTWSSTLERSRLPIDPNNLGYVDILFAPNGQVLTNLPYAGTANLPTVPFYHFWLTEREGVSEIAATADALGRYLPVLDTGLKGERRLVTLNTRSGNLSVKLIEDFSDTNAPYRDAQNGMRDKQ